MIPWVAEESISPVSLCTPSPSPYTRTPEADEVAILPSAPPSSKSPVRFLKKRRAPSINKDNIKRLRNRHFMADRAIEIDSDEGNVITITESENEDAYTVITISD
jgi:hypothetical protein